MVFAKEGKDGHNEHNLEKSCNDATPLLIMLRGEHEVFWTLSKVEGGMWRICINSWVE